MRIEVLLFHNFGFFAIYFLECLEKGLSKIALEASEIRFVLTSFETNGIEREALMLSSIT